MYHDRKKTLTIQLLVKVESLMWINLMSYISPLLIQETETIKYNFLVDSDF